MEIYVLTNDALPGLIKVGMTTKNADERADTLGASAAVPENFEVARSYKFPESISYQQLLEVERKAHDLLSEYRYSNRKEFFTCTSVYAGTVIEQLQREATDFLSRGLTITGQPRQATIQSLFQGDKGRKTTLFDKPKIRNTLARLDLDRPSRNPNKHIGNNSIHLLDKARRNITRQKRESPWQVQRHTYLPRPFVPRP